LVASGLLVYEVAVRKSWGSCGRGFVR